jgi:CotH kinase protein
MKNLLILPLVLICLLVQAQNRPLFDKKTIGEIRITLAAKNWNDALDSMRLYGKGMLEGSAVVDGQSYSGVGVRFRGDKSYVQGSKRNPFTIQLDRTVPGQQHQGYTNLKLSSALRDPSMVREVLFYEIAAKYMPALQTSYTKLFINNEYVGVFINIENVEGPFLQNNFGSAGNPLFKAGVDYKPTGLPAGCKQNIYGSLEYEEDMNCYKGNFEMQSAKGWSDLQELTRMLNKDVKNIEKVLDVDRVLWMLALNNVMVNLSSYSGANSTNYYLYQDNNGRFQPIPWDLNLAFGSFKNTGNGSDLELRDLQQLPLFLHKDNPYKPLISQLLKDPLYSKMYVSHVRQIVLENFREGQYEKRATELQAMINPALNEDKFRIYSADEFKSSLSNTIGKKSKIPGIAELMSKRTAYLKELPELTALPPAITDVSVQSRGKFENKAINAFRISAKADRFSRRMLLYYRFNDRSPYQMMTMGEDAATSLPPGVKAFVANVDAPGPDAILDYYLVAENAGTVAFAPLSYSSKPYKLKLSDLNK